MVSVYCIDEAVEVNITSRPVYIEMHSVQNIVDNKINS